MGVPKFLKGAEGSPESFEDKLTFLKQVLVSSTLTTRGVVYSHKTFILLRISLFLQLHQEVKNFHLVLL